MSAIPKRLSLRALITRPRQEAESLAARLAERGIEAVIEPMMMIVDSAGVDAAGVERGGALPDLTGVQAVLCTSANGVGALARASAERGVPVFAVGEATARAARGAGFVGVESA